MDEAPHVHIDQAEFRKRLEQLQLPTEMIEDMMGGSFLEAAKHDYIRSDHELIDWEINKWCWCWNGVLDWLHTTPEGQRVMMNAVIAGVLKEIDLSNI